MLNCQDNSQLIYYFAYCVEEGGLRDRHVCLVRRFTASALEEIISATKDDQRFENANLLTWFFVLPHLWWCYYCWSPRRVEAQLEAGKKARRMRRFICKTRPEPKKEKDGEVGNLVYRFFLQRVGHYCAESLTTRIICMRPKSSYTWTRPTAQQCPGRFRKSLCTLETYHRSNWRIWELPKGS